MIRVFWTSGTVSAKQTQSLMLDRVVNTTLTCTFWLEGKRFLSQACWPIFSQCTLSLPPENIGKTYGFLMFSGGREGVDWEQMGQFKFNKNNS